MGPEAGRGPEAARSGGGAGTGKVLCPSVKAWLRGPCCPASGPPRHAHSPLPLACRRRFNVLIPSIAPLFCAAARMRNPTFLPVQYFGPGEVQCVNLQAAERAGKRGEARPCFATFLEGLERGYHRVTRWAGRAAACAVRPKRLLRALCYAHGSRRRLPARTPYHPPHLTLTAVLPGNERRSVRARHLVPPLSPCNPCSLCSPGAGGRAT